MNLFNCRNLLVFVLVIIFNDGCLVKKKTTQEFNPGPDISDHTDSDDNDRDGVNNVDDRCPNVPGVAKYNGCPIPDSDGDQIDDENDKCPTIAGHRDYYGCPVEDVDRDGVVDEMDTIEYSKPPSGNQSKPVKINQGKSQENKPVTDKNAEDENLGSDESEFPNASIAYAHKNRMFVGATSLIHLRVQLDKPVNELQKQLKVSLSEERAKQVSISDTSEVKSLVIKGIDSFKVSLKFDTSIFSLEDFEGESTQELNSSLPAIWIWRVKAKKATSKSEITLTINGINIKGKSRIYDSKVLPIWILVEPTPNRMSWKWIAIGLIGLGILSLLVKKVFKFKKKEPVYFSYAWDDQKEKMITKLYDILKKDGFNVKKDKIDLKYKGIISDFMKKIGTGKFIIVVLSDEYFRSEFCMLELYFVYMNSKFDREEFSKKLFPVRVEELDLSDKKIVNNYNTYWKLKKEEFENSTDSSESAIKLDYLKRMTEEVDNMLYCLSDINSLKIDELLQNAGTEIKISLRNSMKVITTSGKVSESFS